MLQKNWFFRHFENFAKKRFSEKKFLETSWRKRSTHFWNQYKILILFAPDLEEIFSTLIRNNAVFFKVKRPNKIVTAQYLKKPLFNKLVLGFQCQSGLGKSLDPTPPLSSYCPSFLPSSLLPLLYRPPILPCSPPLILNFLPTSSSPFLPPCLLHRKKSLFYYPVPSRDVTYQTLPGGNNLYMKSLFLPKEIW